MDTPNAEHENTADRARPLGYWLRVVDAHLTAAFAEAFAAEGITRRDWMLLNAVAGSIPDPTATARRGKRLRGLESRGWIEESGDGAWSLTDAGRQAHTRLAAVVDGIRARVVDATGEEQYAATVTALESIAREFGWDGSTGPGSGRRGPRAFRPEIRHGFGPNLHKGFGPGRFPTGIPGDAPHREHGFDGHGHGPHGGRGHGGHRGGRHDDTAFERGFVAGFDAGVQRGSAA